ncbi:hypothetical protein A3762_12115 [Oleiphilus sp. HI0125]|uniref:alpha/beta fold hydrolase n=3 Tax=Oleiphilus sp. HI0125 TaxID=1822266 RepID=UPI0007C393D5|nr:alpha/beta hydrolase [Oleiphilus sp. HI0125]KZZ55300.1 hypothetical protein A3762_12115 [Oleiphilus sp. HI0125]
MAHYFSSDNVKLHYRDIGNGPTIIFLHGFGMHSGHWLPYAYPLSRKYRVIIPDLRGFGRSHHAHFKQDCAVSNYADDVAELISELNVSSFKLIGISMGALTSISYIDKYKPAGLERYLHIDQSPCCVNKSDWRWGLFGHEHDDRMQRAKQLLDELEPYLEQGFEYRDLPNNLRQQIQTELSEFFASAMSWPSFKQLSRLLLSKEWILRQLLSVKNWGAYMHCLRAYIDQGYDFRQAIENCETPIDILVGMKSDMYPATGQLRMADLNERCSVLPFTKSGHTPLIDQPFKLTRELHRFATA